MKQKPKRRRSILLRLLVLGVSVFMVVNLISRGNELAKEKEFANKRIVVIIPDSGERYLSTWLFAE